MLFPNDKIFAKCEETAYRRLSASYTNKSGKYLLKSKDYSKQFAHIYASRLQEMTELLVPMVHRKWGNEFKIKKLSELREENPEKCILIGTLFKHQVLKPSILREISEENQLAPQPPRSNYVDESDKLILEDELQRIRLIGKVDIHHIVTGIVCAVLGYVESDGRFVVDDMLFYESGPQALLKSLDQSPLLILISGLDLASTTDFSTSLELLQHWLFGNIGGLGIANDWESASIVRVIIAGNCIRTVAEVKQRTLQTRAAESSNTLDAVEACDKLVTNWSESVTVDIMPGEFDPSNYMLPQQPLHASDRQIVGTSGQNIADIIRTSKIEDPIEALKHSLIWGHIAPTSPDTLPCYPYVENDPFVLETCPHIYFAGNQSEFKSDYYTGENGKQTLLVCIPTFSTTKSVAVVNLRTLECNQICFNVDLFEE